MLGGVSFHSPSHKVQRRRFGLRLAVEFKTSRAAFDATVPAGRYRGKEWPLKPLIYNVNYENTQWTCVDKPLPVIAVEARNINYTQIRR
jgi:hypothetical protein